MPGTALGIRDTAVSKRQKNPAPVELSAWWRKRNLKKEVHYLGYHVKANATEREQGRGRQSSRGRPVRRCKGQKEVRERATGLRRGSWCSGGWTGA